MNPIDKITETIYIGDCFAATSEEILKKTGIKRALSYMGNLSPKYKEVKIIQKVFELSDYADANLYKIMKESLLFIDESVKANDKILVHCFAGFSRSASFVIAYFMWKNKMSYEESYKFVNEKRNVGPNSGFVKQLKIFQKQLKDCDYNLDLIDFDGFVWPPNK